MKMGLLRSCRWLFRTAAGLLICNVSVAVAAPFSVEGIVLDIPTGFEGPLTQSAQGANIYAFSKPSATAGFKTLLQITIANVDASASAVSVERCVLDFLKGIERRRTEFSQGEVSQLKVAGLPASRVAWKGMLQSTQANGVMYCVVVNDKAIVLHTQDTSANLTRNMKNALAAFEDLKLAPAN